MRSDKSGISCQVEHSSLCRRRQPHASRYPHSAAHCCWAEMNLENIKSNLWWCITQKTLEHPRIILMGFYLLYGNHRLQQTCWNLFSSELLWLISTFRGLLYLEVTESSSVCNEKLWRNRNKVACQLSLHHFFRVDSCQATELEPSVSAKGNALPDFTPVSSLPSEIPGSSSFSVNCEINNANINRKFKSKQLLLKFFHYFIIHALL